MKGKSITFDSWMSPDQIGTHVSSQWSRWNSLRSSAIDKWKEVESYVYATDTRSLAGGQNFDHSTHIPVVHEIREDLLSIMYSTTLPHDDFIGWKPFDKEAATKEVREKVKAYLDNRHALNGFRSTFAKLISDYLDYGNAFAQVHTVDESTTLEDGTVVPGYIGPSVRRISPYDIVFDPTADNFLKTPKIIKTMESIGEFITKANEYGFDEEKVQSILDRRSTISKVDLTQSSKNMQYVPDGFTSIQAYYTSGTVELLWFYGDVHDTETGTVHRNQMCVVADRATLLHQSVVPDPMIFKAGWKPKPDNLWSQGAFDQIIGLNHQINHRENAKNDAIDRFIYPDRVYRGEVEEIYDEETGSLKLLAPEGGSVDDLRPDTAVLTFNSEIDRLVAAARSAARLPPSLSGFRTPGEKTAFEVQDLSDGAFRGFVHKAEQFEMHLLEKVLNAEIEVGRLTLNSMLQAEGTSPEGIRTFLEITEDDLKANGKLVPYGARRFARMNQQLGMLTQLSNSNLMQYIGQHMKTTELAKTVEYLGGLGDFKVFDSFAAIEEQAEAMQLQQQLEQMMVDQASKPSMREQLMEPEEEEEDIE